jgi:hypothetical protein
MVLNVCCSVLRHEHDAEDAFRRLAGTQGPRESSDVPKDDARLCADPGLGSRRVGSFRCL